MQSCLSGERLANPRFLRVACFYNIHLYPSRPSNYTARRSHWNAWQKPRWSKYVKWNAWKTSSFFGLLTFIIFSYNPDLLIPMLGVFMGTPGKNQSVSGDQNMVSTELRNSWENSLLGMSMQRRSLTSRVANCKCAVKRGGRAEVSSWQLAVRAHFAYKLLP